jgi:hypothetical protein
VSSTQPGNRRGRHGFPVISSEEERKSKEGRPQLRLRDGASVECLKDVERRTGRAEPIPALDRCARVLEGSRNLMRVRKSRRKAAGAVTRSLITLEDRCDATDQLPRQASH